MDNLHLLHPFSSLLVLPLLLLPNPYPYPILYSLFSDLLLPTAFARAFNLKTHVSTHDPNRLKPHMCHHPGCGRSFSRKHDLGRHLISIHKDESGIKLTNSGSSAASTYGVSGHPLPHVSAGVHTSAGRVHQVDGNNNANNTGGRSAKGTSTPTNTVSILLFSLVSGTLLLT